MTDACYIFGYGSESLTGDPTLDLRLAPVNIITYESCLKELGPSNAPEHNSGMFCAIGANPGVDACSVSQMKIVVGKHINTPKVCLPPLVLQNVEKIKKSSFTISG